VRVGGMRRRLLCGRGTSLTSIPDVNGRSALSGSGSVSVKRALPFGLAVTDGICEEGKQIEGRFIAHAQNTRRYPDERLRRNSGRYE
jgi:hypothetical protein